MFFGFMKYASSVSSFFKSMLIIIIATIMMIFLDTIYIEKKISINA
jgi:hypothetical protein